jgi:hypothetical protein
MGTRNTGETSTQADTYQPRHESTGNSANNAGRILGRLRTERASR